MGDKYIFMGMPETAIQYQTDIANERAADMNSDAQVSQSRVRYQMSMYNSVQYVNQILVAIYMLLFTIIHVLMFNQYLMGVKRDEIADSIWLTVFFLYPYLIGYVERAIYDGVGFIVASVYGQAYVSNFDKLLVSTDFYRNR
jgi:hypothetical protein